MKEERSIIFNNPTSDPEWIKTPDGHPYITRFLGVPLKQGGRTIGMIALANKEEDYHLFDQEAVEDLSIAFVEAISSKKGELDTKRQLREMTALHAVAMAGTEILNEDQLIHNFTQIIGESIYKDHFGILMLDKVGGNLHPHPSYRGIDEIHMQEIIPLGKGISGRVAVTGQPWLVSDVSEESSYLEVSPHTRSELAVPLIASGQVHGVINVESNNINAFDKRDERLLMTLASHLSTSITKIRLLHDYQKKSQHLTSIHQVAISLSSLLDIDLLLQELYKQVFGLFAPDTFLVALFNNESEEVKIVLAVEEKKDLSKWVGKKYDLKESGLTGWVIREEKSLLVRDIEQEILPAKPKYGKRLSKSWLGVPLISQDGVMGVMSVQSFEKQAFDEDHKFVMETLGAQAAIAIENARLFSETKRRLDYLHSLQIIEEAITSNFGLKLTLEILLEQTISCLDVDAADVLLFNSASKLLEFQAGLGFYTAALKHSRLRLGEGFAGTAAKEGRVIIIPNLEEEKNGLARSTFLPDENFISYVAVPLIAQSELKGVLEIFHREPLKIDDVWMDFLETISSHAAIALDISTLFENLQFVNKNLTLAYDATLEGWAKALELRDRETENHSRRVTSLTLQLARAMEVDEKDLIHIRRGAILHDIGKLGVPDEILLKPSKLSESEWTIMKKHPKFAYDMLSSIEYLRPALDIPYCHHEKWDGSGYPQGLKGEEIPLAARIFAIVDVWDALRSERSYRKAWPEKKVRKYILEQSGKYFDPRVVEAFYNLISAENIDIY